MQALLLSQLRLLAPIIPTQGNSTDSLANSWLGGASVAGALYGDSTPDESGGRVNVNLYKSGDTGTAGANDFYFAEGIYLVD